MRLTFILATYAALSFSAAHAADLTAAPMAVERPPLRGTFSWEGGYIGANVSYVRANSTATEVQTAEDGTSRSYCAPRGTAGVPAGMYYCNINGGPHYTSSPVSAYNQIGDSWGTNMNSVAAGFGAGYNFQRGAFVYGVEADYNYLGASGRSGPSPASRDDTFLHTNAASLMTARLRTGYAFDRVLVYATGGGAAGEFNSYVDDPDIPVGIMTQKTNLQWGYVFGGGIEYAFADHWTIKGEYLHAIFPGQTSMGYVNVTNTSDATVPSWKVNRAGMAGDGTAGWKIAQTLDLVRLGLNYKF